MIGFMKNDEEIESKKSNPKFQLRTFVACVKRNVPGRFHSQINPESDLTVEPS